jgi:nucleoside-diphosphate-sugar epimerase
MNNKSILILGGNSFIARSIYPFLKEKYNVISLTRQQLDVTNINKLKEFFKNKYFDFIINCAIKGGRLLKQYTSDDFFQNILMIENLLFLHDYYNKLIFFSSGAQEDRTKNIINLKEGQFFEPPNNFYSLSKYFTAKRVLNNDKVINIRIFNVFGELEKEDRFIKRCINNYINKRDIEIWGDKYFDFFYYKDLVILIDFYIQNPPNSYEEINVVYNKKNKMSEIANIINNLNIYKVNIVIKKGINCHYTGCGDKLKNLHLPLFGLEYGIKEIYKIFTNE